jgi:hypothetical protein
MPITIDRRIMSAKLRAVGVPLMVALATSAAAVGVIGSFSAWRASDHTAADGRPADLAAAADGPGSIVEDFSYPDAAAILASKNVKLIAGDGHLLIADCATPPVDNVSTLKVRTSDIKEGDKGLICFKVLQPTAYLRLEVPGVYEIHGDGDVSGAGHKVSATVKNDDQTFDPAPIPPAGYLHVGLGNGDALPTTLLELRATP